jgi:hypothetical protein
LSRYYSASSPNRQLFSRLASFLIGLSSRGTVLFPEECRIVDVPRQSTDNFRKQN